MDDLTDVVAAMATELAPEAAERVAGVVESVDAPGFGLRAAISRAVLPGAGRELGQLLNDLWQHDTDRYTAHGLATGIRAASRAAERVRGDQQVDLVWTGPPSLAFKARRADIALQDVIHAARRDLVLMSYAGYPLPDVEQLLARRLEDGLTLWCVFETTEDATGKFIFDGKDAFGHLADHGDVRFLRWPHELRPPGVSSSMHAKVALADDHTMLVTSANLTDSALQHNIEVGLFVRGGRLPAAMAAHVHDMITRKVFVPHM